MADNTTGVPTTNVKSLTLKRSGNTMTAKWTVPAELTKASSKTRATSIDYTWILGIPGKDPKYIDRRNKLSVKTDSVSLNSFNAGSMTYTRASFYPVTPSRPLTSVTIKVAGRNKNGVDKNPASCTMRFKVPGKPIVGEVEFDPDTGIASATITAATSDGAYERYDTEYYWTVYDSETATNVVSTHTASTGATIALSYDATGYQSIAYGQYVRVSLKARSRGFAGASAWVAVPDLYIGFPLIPEIKSVSIPDKSSSGKVTAYIDTAATDDHPITQVVLQKLDDVTYDDASSIPSSAEWEDVGAPDNGACTALACSVSDLNPADGKWTWLRLHTWYLNEAALYAYSEPWRVEQLHVDAATATNDAVWVLSAAPGDDGTTADVTLGWGKDGSTDDADGTLLEWSDNINAWRMAGEPDSFQMPDGDWDAGSTTVDGHTYSGHASIIIPSLDEGAPTYVRARRYTEGDFVTYGPRSDMASIIPSVAPSSVTLSVPAYVAEGAGVPFEWTFSGGSTQTGWQLVLDGGTILAEGTDALGSYELDAGRAASMATGGVLTVSVAVSTGGGWVESEQHDVTIISAPTLSVTVPATLTAQPLAFSAASSVDAELLCVLTADGVTSQGPGGLTVQPAGDTVWSDAVLPMWSSGTATVTLPAGLDLIDGASYTLTVTAIDPATGLSSALATGVTTVDWSHQAPDPDGCVTLTPRDTYDVYGNRVRSVTIDLTPPTGYAAGDLYDIYRLTNDGPAPIGEGWPLTSTSIDALAPFGDGFDLAYRVACRTADGDVEWADVPYKFPGDVIRIDWTDGWVELPYDIALGGGWSKDVDVHTYLDGGTDALYNPGVTRKAKLTTDVMRIDQQDTVAAVKALARHVGPAFVRTPVGEAYLADVQVSAMDTSGPVYAVSIDAIEVRLTPAYMLPPYNVEDLTEVEP